MIVVTIVRRWRISFKARRPLLSILTARLIQHFKFILCGWYICLPVMVAYNWMNLAHDIVCSRREEKLSYLCRPDVEFGLPVSYVAPHGSTPRGIGLGWAQPPTHCCRQHTHLIVLNSVPHLSNQDVVVVTLFLTSWSLYPLTAVSTRGL